MTNLEDWVNQDIRLSIEGRDQTDPVRRRERKGEQHNVWKMPAR